MATARRHRGALTESLPALVSTPDICEMLGVHKTTVVRWRRNGTLPTPAQTASGPVWTRDDIEWFRDHSGLLPASERPGSRHARRTQAPV